MKIVTHFLENVTGIEIYPLVSFVIFFVFFLAVTLYVLRLDKKLIDEVASYPLGIDEDEKSEKRNLTETQ